MICKVSSGSSCLCGFVLFTLVIVCLVGIYGKDQQLISLVTWFLLFCQAWWYFLADLALRVSDRVICCCLLPEVSHLSYPMAGFCQALSFQLGFLWHSLFYHLWDHSGIQADLQDVLFKDYQMENKGMEEAYLSLTTSAWKQHIFFLYSVGENIGTLIKI